MDEGCEGLSTYLTAIPSGLSYLCIITLLCFLCSSILGGCWMCVYKEETKRLSAVRTR
jgi:hypothetical protein